MRTYNILVISPFPVVYTGLEGIIKKEKDFCLLKERANDYMRAMRLVKKSNSDIVVAGVSPRFLGNIVEDIRHEDPYTPILVYSGCKDYGYVKVCFGAGANGYLLMSEPEKRIVRAIRTVLRGRKYVSNEVKNYKKVSTALDKYVVPIHSLTNREAEIFDLIGQGCNNKEIAEMLHIKKNTLKVHLKSLRIKSGISMDEVRKYAIQYALQMARMRR